MGLDFAKSHVNFDSLGCMSIFIAWFKNLGKWELELRMESLHYVLILYRV